MWNFIENHARKPMHTAAMSVSFARRDQNASSRLIRGRLGSCVAWGCAANLRELDLPGRRNRGIDEFAEPHFEHEQTPDVGGAVGAAGDVLVDQRADR